MNAILLSPATPIKKLLQTLLTKPEFKEQINTLLAHEKFKFVKNYSKIQVIAFMRGDDCYFHFFLHHPSETMYYQALLKIKKLPFNQYEYTLFFLPNTNNHLGQDKARNYFLVRPELTEGNRYWDRNRNAKGSYLSLFNRDDVILDAPAGRRSKEQRFLGLKKAALNTISGNYVFHITLDQLLSDSPATAKRSDYTTLFK